MYNTTMNAKTILKHAMLIFVWISVGFAVGREFPRQGAVLPADSGQAPAAGTALKPDRAVVYYFHGTKRCEGCNLVEQYAREVIDTQFADALRDGRLEWQSLDYTQQRELARRYEVAGNMIVVIPRRAGGDGEAYRLDDIMLRRHDKADFFDYVGWAIRGCLPNADLPATGPSPATQAAGAAG